MSTLEQLLARRSQLEASLRSCQSELDNLYADYSTRSNQVEENITDYKECLSSIEESILTAAFSDLPKKHPETDHTKYKVSFRTPALLADTTDKKFLSIGFFTSLPEALTAHDKYAADLSLQCHEAKITDTESSILYVFSRRNPTNGVFTNYRWFGYGIDLPEKFENNPNFPMSDEVAASFYTIDAESKQETSSFDAPETVPAVDDECPRDSTCTDPGCPYNYADSGDTSTVDSEAV